MANKDHLYVIGHNPYEHCKGDYHTRGNGDWHTKATCMTDALQVIFGSMSFPGEPTGRKCFVPGISLSLPADDIIQVWSSDPEVRKRTMEILGEDMSGLHDGQGRDFGLEAEIPVTEIEKYLQPVRKLLAAPAEEVGNIGTSPGISPLGASVIRYHEVKHEIQQAAQVQKMEIAKKQWEIENLANGMQEKMDVMKQQIGVFDAYLHGTRHRTQMCRGSSGTGRYKVFQNRVFLAEEVAILGNFVDMDFKDMEGLEKWLVESGHIWTLLPHERCILATRVRQEKKEYGDPMANYWNNIANMQNIIWIRDGQNVFHVDVEYDFHNAVFPRRDQFDQAKRVVQDSLFVSSFKWSPPTNWHGAKLKPGEYDVPGQMKRKPLEEAEPYCTVRIVHNRFKKIEDWLDDKECDTELLDKQITDAVYEFLRNRNKRQMLFAVIMQGIVDNTNYLAIPKGTDMFNWENVDTYLELLYDYSHGLPFKGWAEKVEPFTSRKAAPGDWIVALVDEHEKPAHSWQEGKHIRESRWMLLRVVGMEAVEKSAYDMEERESKKRVESCPVVNYYPKVIRHSYALSYAENEKRRTKSPRKLTLKESLFIRVPMSPQYAVDILNDREWKRDNRRLVPVMVNYARIIEAMKWPVNGTILKWDKYDE